MLELGVCLLGSDEMARATGSVCQVTPVAHDDEPLLREHGRPAFLLVEGGRRAAVPAARLSDLLAICERRDIPRFLWITASRFDRLLIPMLPRFSRVFSVDRDHLGMLRAVGAQAPALLWPGTTLPLGAEPGPAPGAERPDAVLWPGALRRDWPEDLRARLDSILEAARPHGLRIVDPASASELRSRLHQAKIVVATDPAGAGRRFAPRVAFDAMACGAVVMTPHTFASVFDFSLGAWRQSSWRELISMPADGNAATAEIERLLTDDGLRAETAETCARIVRYNHTHVHRIATLASAAGIRLVPDATESPAHS